MSFTGYRDQMNQSPPSAGFFIALYWTQSDQPVGAMTKAEYLESQRGKTYTEIIEAQPVETVIGSIRGANLRDVVAILAAGLQYRLDTTALPTDAEPLRTALLTAFKYMTLPDYGINLAMADNVGMLRAAVSVGLVTPDESARFFELASYARPRFNITREDCAAYFGAGWIVTEPTDARQFVITLQDSPPEVTYIVVQWQDPRGNWFHATGLHGVQAAIEYSAPIPYHGQPRRLRWFCEYALNAL